MQSHNKTARFARIAAAVLFFSLICLAFSGTGRIVAARLPGLQFAPALMSCLAAFSLGALLAVFMIALLTFCFGRFYCAFFCPLGILQDLIGFVSRRKGEKMPNCRKTRYLTAGLSFGMVLAGWSVPFLLLDPYSNFGRIAGSFTIGGILPLVLIVLLAVWKKRLYCTAVCPVGTLLGLLAKRGVFRLRLTERCVKCGQCVRMCPSGCIDPAAGTIDNERCVRCLNCLAVCRVHAVKFGRPEKKAQSFDEGRRAFLVNGGILIAGFAAGAALAKTGMGKLAAYAKRFSILPPGAGDAGRFALKCTACQLCTVNCPAKIIVPAPGGDGPVSLDLSRGACLYECNRCSQVCPTGAIRPLTLEVKRKTKIAEARLNPRICIVFQEGEKCGKCASVCPTGAVTLRKTGAPRPVNPALCIGCGACQQVCPAPGKAMTIVPVEQQALLEG